MEVKYFYGIATATLTDDTIVIAPLSLVYLWDLSGPSILVIWLAQGANTSELTAVPQVATFYGMIGNAA